MQALQLVLVLSVLISSGLCAQCAGTGHLHTMDIMGCQVVCDCKFRTSVETAWTRMILELKPDTERVSILRAQSCSFALPFVNLKTYHRSGQGQALLPGRSSSGTMTLRVQHIDTCAGCDASDENCVFVGWSAPGFYFTGFVDNKASYEVTASMQASFNVLQGASTFLQAVERARGQTGVYSFQTTVGVQVGSLGSQGFAATSFTYTPGQVQHGQPNQRHHYVALQVQEKKSIQETVEFIARIDSMGDAKSTLQSEGLLPPTWKSSTASALLKDADYCAGIRAICICSGGGHGPAGSAGLTPVLPGPVPPTNGGGSTLGESLIGPILVGPGNIGIEVRTRSDDYWPVTTLLPPGERGR